MADKLEERILSILSTANEPLETTEVEKSFPSESRSKIMYRLNNLRGSGKLKGKQVGSGKGTWIWWVVK